MNEASAQVSWWLWTCIGLLLLSQSTVLFLHARSRGGRAWFWGLWGLTQFPCPTLVYLLLQWRRNRKRGLIAAESAEREDGGMNDG
ncbi:sigmaY antisigma factor component [Cohnella herbarum]|uniref:SigmaY antisigma factor component n=1 Tax=Cohnella herbarum TaxID=2728023 RepID=A0A7Z2VJM6_9BACL|nr:sigmaY antisigma factor component [Cohnella herbarum]QJD84317.1 sigmaY antisigma factor component [Cohnella herbarum]